ncbi:MAG: stage II sporulation protein D [Clostridia bacterium]|nr:stage II sporulation protein D [Clostridia bacterium]
MQITHNIQKIGSKETIYIYVTIEDVYEFGDENFSDGKYTNFLSRLRKYVKKNFNELGKASVVLVINGVVIGTVAMSAILPKTEENIGNNTNAGKVSIYEEEVKIEEDKEKLEDKESAANQKEEKTTAEEGIKEENKTETKEESKKKVTANTSSSNTKKTNNTKTTTSSTKKPTTNTNNKTNATAKNKTNTNTTNKDTNKNSSTSTTSTKEQKVETIKSGIYINLNNNGTVSKIDIEEYIIGVVAAEMPASFHTEALKAQAILARTYAIKKAKAGVTLLNSTYHQVYNTVDQMKKKWGTSFNAYYNKVKNAVESTKGKVLTYNGGYIEAVYYAISNGSSELPKYVWNSTYPYLQAVSSNWDKDLSVGKYTVKLTYEKVSKKLGIDVNKETEFNVLSKTEGNRIAEIKVGETTFEGNKFRRKLGLRSTDFEITKTDVGLTITTHGYGHGIGMSQYGANGAAKAGYTYKQILNHYYPGTMLGNI